MKAEQPTLIPFCTREGPWKYLTQVNSTLRKGRPKALAVGNEFVPASEDDYRTGALIEPASHLVQARQGDWDLRDFRKHWQSKAAARTHELVACPRGHGGWCYIGRYKGAAPVAPMEPEEFRALPKKTRKAVYRLTGAGGGPAGKPPHDVPAMYAAGELKAVRTELRQVRFSEDVNQALFDAADRRAGAADW